MKKASLDMNDLNRQLPTDDLKEIVASEMLPAIRQSPTGELTESDIAVIVSKMETVQKIRTVRVESGRSVEIELAEDPLVANLATTQRQQDPTIADFATVELVANCDRFGQRELNLVVGLKEAA